MDSDIDGPAGLRGASRHQLASRAPALTVELVPAALRTTLSSLIATEIDRFDVQTASLPAAERPAKASELRLRAREAERCLAESRAHPGGGRLAELAMRQLGVPARLLGQQQRAFADAEGLRAYCDLLTMEAESVTDTTRRFPKRNDIFARRHCIVLCASSSIALNAVSPELLRTMQGFSAEDGSLLLSEIFERFLRAGEAESKWKKPELASTRVYGPIFDDFLATVGDCRLADITISQVRRYAESIRARSPMSSGTKAKYLDRIAAVLSWAHAQGLMQDLTAPLRMTPTYRSYEALSTEDLRRLFECERYALCRFKKSAEFWAPLMALYTGARVDEIASIKLDALSEAGPIPSVLLSPGGSATGKNDYARRRVPLHPALIKAGLLDYVAVLRRESHDELFPEIRAAQRDGKGKRVSDDFQTFRRSCCVGAASGRGTKTFHSFRSTFTTALQCAGVGAELRRSILGHAPVDIHERTYSQGELPLDQKAAAIALVRFDFQHPVWRDTAPQRRTRRVPRRRTKG